MNEEFTRKLAKLNKDYKRGFLTYYDYMEILENLKTIYNIEGGLENE